MSKVKNNSNNARKRRKKVLARVRALRARQREINPPGMIKLSLDQLEEIKTGFNTALIEEFESGIIEKEEFTSSQSVLDSFLNNPNGIWAYKSRLKLGVV